VYDVKPITSGKTVDCGPTCLAMLLDYYGMQVPLDQLTRECNTCLIGCTAKDLLRVGRAHGLREDFSAWKMDTDELIRQDRPAIIWWMYAHWCVFCGRDDAENVVICNPDMGRYRMRPDTFNSFYAGVALFNGEPENLPE